MKTVILAACMLAATVSFASPKENLVTYSVKKGDGQHIPASQVPAPVMADFKARYPKATNTQWELESEHGMQVYQAEFKKGNGRKAKAEWLADGTYLGEK